MTPHIGRRRTFPFHLTAEDVTRDSLSDQTLHDILPSARIIGGQGGERYQVVFSSTTWTGRTEAEEMPWHLWGKRFDPPGRLKISQLHREDRTLLRIRRLGVEIVLPLLLCRVNQGTESTHHQWVLWVYLPWGVWHYYLAIPKRETLRG